MNSKILYLSFILFLTPYQPSERRQVDGLPQEEEPTNNDNDPCADEEMDVAGQDNVPNPHAVKTSTPLLSGVELIALGDQLSRDDKFKEALRCYTKAITKHSPEAMYYRHRGVCHLKMKSMDEAMNDIEKAVELDPRDLDGMVLLEPEDQGTTTKEPEAKKLKVNQKDGEPDANEMKFDTMNPEKRLEWLLAYLIRVEFEDTELEIKKISNDRPIEELDEKTIEKINDLETKRDNYLKEILFALITPNYDDEEDEADFFDYTFLQNGPMIMPEELKAY